MSHAIEVVADATSPVVVKRATGDGADALRREGERLRAAAHPGVVELLGSSGTDDGWELRMVHGGRPLEVMGHLPVGQVAAIVAALATTLADLHDLGVVHGRVDGAHALVGRHGRPVLCGLGPGPAPGGPAPTPADDVAALGALLATLVGPTVDPEPIPDRRWWPRRSSVEWERRTLLLLADQACAEPPTRRPTARRLAAAVAEAVPAAAVVVATAPPADPIEALRANALTDVPARRTARLPSLAVALLGVGLMGLGAIRTVAGGPRVAEPTVTTTTAAVTTTTTATRVLALPPTTTSTVAPAPCVLLPGTAAPESCAGDVRIDGTLVSVAGRTYEVGQPGDLVVLGDWDCVGGATPAVLRPSTGEVFVFTAWSSAADLVIGPLDQVDRGRALVAEPRPGGCAALVVQRDDGSSVDLRVGRAA